MNRRNLSILSVALLAVMLGFGVVIPIFPFYIEEMGGGGTELGLLVAVASVMELLCAPLWGAISDRAGRKPVLLIGLFGSGLSLLTMGLASELWMLFVARALSGVLSSATLPSTMAYVGDSTSEEERGGGMGVLGAAMGLGVIAGPGLGGLLAAGSLSTPFFVAAGLSLISLFLAWFFLPESLPDDARAPGSVRDLFRLRRAQSPAVAGAARRSQWRAILRGPLGPLLLMAFLLSFGLASFDAIFGLYALEKFGYGPERVGTILMVVALVSAVGKGLLTGPATRRWGETRVIKGSLIAGAVGFILLALAGSYVTILLATGFFVLSKTLLRPCILALTSRRAPLRQGMAMGLSNTFMSLGRAVGPLWAGFIFDVNVNLPYLSGAAVLFLGFLASLVLLPPDERRVASAPLSEGEPMAQR